MNQLVRQEEIKVPQDILNDLQAAKQLLKSNPGLFVKVKTTTVTRKAFNLPCRMLAASVLKMKCGNDAFDRQIDGLADEFKIASEMKLVPDVSSQCKVFSDASGFHFACFLYQMKMIQDVPCVDCIYLFSDRTIEKDSGVIISNAALSGALLYVFAPQVALADIAIAAASSYLYSNLIASHEEDKQKKAAKALVIAKLLDEGLVEMDGDRLRLIA